MNAQEAIKIITVDLEMSKSASEFFEKDLDTDMSSYREVEQALSIVLESARLLHEFSGVNKDGESKIFFAEIYEVLDDEFAKSIGIEEGVE